jgi:hypothetical protein
LHEPINIQALIAALTFFTFTFRDISGEENRRVYLLTATQHGTAKKATEMVLLH